MSSMTPQQVAANWQRGLSSATDKIKAGINAVTEAPTARAARRVDAQVAGVQRAAASGKTAAALNAVSLDDWKQAFLNKGVSRIASGATTAQNKMADFYTQFLPAVDAAKASLQPRGDLEQNLQRANDMARKLAQFKYRR